MNASNPMKRYRTPENLKDSYFNLDLFVSSKNKGELTIFIYDQSLIKGYEKMRTGFIAKMISRT